MKIYQTYSSDETRRLGAELASQLVENNSEVLNHAKVFALTGDLGSGKTTFVQGFLSGLGVKKRVNSPTFVLVKRFKLKNLSFKDAYHIDAYRLERPREILGLGLKEIMLNPESIVLVEWADKVGRYLPKDAVWVRFKHTKKRGEAREISVI